MFHPADLIGPALTVSPSFGGVPAIAKLALSAFHSCVMTKDHVDDTNFHFIPFSACLTREVEINGKRVADEFMDTIYELDGIAKLIEGTHTHGNLFSSCYAFWQTGGSESIATLALMVLGTIIEKNRRRVEYAGRCGILGLFVALDADRGDFSPSLVNAAKRPHRCRTNVLRLPFSDWCVC